MPGQFSWEDLLRGINNSAGPMGQERPSQDSGGDDKRPRPSAPHIDFGGMSRAQKIIWAVVIILVIAFCYWWFHPALNIHSADMWLFITIVILLPAFLIFRNKSHQAYAGSLEEPPDEKRADRFKKLSWIPLGIFLLVIIGGISSWSLIPGNAERYANILQTTDEDFATDIEEVNYNNIPVIDKESAALLGNRTLGDIPEYVSQFEISDLYSQINYQGKPVRVSPLGYADFFKWLNNMDSGLPAYVIVDMTTQNAKVVKLDKHIMFSQSEPFDRNIDRYVQLKYPTKMFGEKSFEIDEQGTPYWVCPVLDYTIGLFGGETISEVILVNAQTGECTQYAIGDCPEWVDRAYPSDLLIKQYNWSGAYANGWLNSWLGQTGVKQTTPGANGDAGYNYIAKDDDVWLYTGVTSATDDNSIIGFVLINQRTAESHFYSVSGATEESAMSSAEGQVQNLRYTSTFPLLINIGGQPTYFMSLKDSAGLVKKYAMIDIQRYQNVAIGDTVSECQKSYKALLASNGVKIDNNGSSDGTKTASGVISRMATAVVDSNSHYYVTLKGDDNIYDFPLPSMLDIVRYKEGDTIKFTYYKEDTTCLVQEIK
ncbi:MAG: Tat pathway signal sequence [Eggerthellaceae bacterium]